VAVMARRHKPRETIARARDLEHGAERVLLISLRTELRVLRTVWILAEQETGQDRVHRLREAEKDSKRFSKLLNVSTSLSRIVTPSPKTRQNI